jgi:hypothetical protein
MVNYRRAKHPLTLLRCYSLILNGADDIDLLNQGLKITDIVKTRNYHEAISKGRHYITAAYENSVDILLAKKLVHMYEQHSKGEPVSFCAKRTQVTLAFRFLLDGLADNEILDRGISVSDIDSAKRFIEIISDIEKMLLSTVARQFQISRHSVARMLRIHRDKQAEITMEEMNDNRIPIPLTA